MDHPNPRIAVSEGDLAFLSRLVDGEVDAYTWVLAENGEERSRMRSLAMLGLVEPRSARWRAACSACSAEAWQDGWQQP